MFVSCMLKSTSCVDACGRLFLRGVKDSARAFGTLEDSDGLEYASEQSCAFGWMHGNRHVPAYMYL
eukprot:256900-Pleurochrysis_carterae.AAC.1